MERIASIILQLWFLTTAPFRRNLVTNTSPSIYSIDYAGLKNTYGISLLIFDLDDTLTPWRGTIQSDVIDLFKSIQKDNQLTIAILSNSTKKRIERITKILESCHILIMQSPTKPLAGGFKKILSYHNVSPEKAAMIGDRLATDMWGAQRAGIAQRILVKPYPTTQIEKYQPPIMQLVRAIEQTLYRDTNTIVG